MLAPPRRQSLIPPPGHANRPAQIPTAGRPCWRPSAGNALCHRRTTPTVRPKSRLPAVHVGAPPPSKPYAIVGPRQQSGPNPACQPSMLAPLRRQSLIPPPGHANRPAQIPPAGRPCWRLPAGKTLCHRRATPTGRPKSRLPAAHVGVVRLRRDSFYTEIYKPTIFCLHLDRYGLKTSLPIKTVLKGNFFYEIIVLSMESCNI